MTTPGQRIQIIRKQKGLTQRQVADQCNPPMDFTGIGRIERGHGFTGESLRRIAEVLDCKVEDFFLPDELAFWRNLSPEDKRLITTLGQKLAGPASKSRPQLHLVE